MKRTQLARSRKPIPKRSAKMKDIYERKGGRRELVARLLSERPRCEARITAYCTKASQDIHEVLRRSAGGSITDVSNLLAVCRACHTYITEHPRLAESLGLSQRRWPRVAANVAGKQSQPDLGSK